MNLSKTHRIESLDLLKGLVIVFMCLDHTRDYFHYSVTSYSPTDPEKTNLALFFTRWITHYCAPTFSLLAGISAFLVGRRKSKKELSTFLVKRGVWLIFIELTVVNFAWFFDIHFSTPALLVIWSLGISMLFLAAIIHLPLKYILVFSLVIIVGHNALDFLHVEKNFIWSIMHQYDSFALENGRVLDVVYPIIPWIGVMSLGFYIGSFYDRSYEPEQRQKTFKRMGVLAIMSFFIFRMANMYGNANHWQSYDTMLKTVFSFMNPTKYPPSLTYLLMTLGPVMLILAYTENAKGKVVNFFSVFGKVPFFFYIIHIYVIHGLAMLLATVTGFGWRSMILNSEWVTSPELNDYGVRLEWVYLVWIAIIMLTYPLCKKFSRYKLNHKEKKWLSYL